MNNPITEAERARQIVEYDIAQAIRKTEERLSAVRSRLSIAEDVVVSTGTEIRNLEIRILELGRILRVVESVDQA